MKQVHILVLFGFSIYEVVMYEIALSTVAKFPTCGLVVGLLRQQIFHTSHSRKAAFRITSTSASILA